MKVAVLEAAGNVGGAAVTDEFLPGFRNSAASYTVSLLQPKVIRDLELERHGLKVVLRKTDNFLPGDGDYLLAGRNERSLYKLVVDEVTDEIVGVHMIGPDAPEILQAAAIAVKARLKKKDFDATVALHPTMAEELVLMR